MDYDYGGAIPDYYGGVSDRQDLNQLMSEMYCTNTKCSWQGPIYRSNNRKCPYCNSKIRNLNNNDGFFFHGHVPKKIYPKPEYHEDYEPYERPLEIDGSYRLQTNTSSLPYIYQYYGHDKIKAGKGYKKDGTPKGVQSGKCKECDGTVISIKMNTSSRGFETTSEKVCDKCGLTVPGSFQVLEPKEEYKSKHYNTYEEWLEDNYPRGDMDDTDMYLENYYHLYGGKDFGASFETGFYNRYTKFPKRLDDAIKRLANTPHSMKISSSARNRHKHHELAEDYIHMVQLNKTQAIDVHYYINNIPGLFKWPYNIEEIILHLCLVIYGLSTNRYKLGGKIKNLPSTIQYNRVLYQLIKEKLV